ncbi:hypothetical protein [Mycolicibacterium brumae]|uniref:Uncharacterized protein n=1 Tax=Mycolicibacterium brumae TaxID=85968 RepID=A0A2G5PE01_9MYCO|nr:hypothetical protein [Mycolicibacterium brumae]MCV7191870.1 hypothetical protein [Mycolicibacterium brumae]PIB76253.1 hypothetical protein CQY22_005895 [Mycolicibacterium brumae]RWA15751.1 hypothetical protein MBRU_09370 [Mycolicibacterium brumae DSM 44177]UWW07176.1 hypothetical protein L2Z93_000170 [Mycolicibacterium brumae]
MSDNTIRCGLDGCTSHQCESFSAHTWKGETHVSGCLPTAIPHRTRYLSIYVEIDDRHRQPDELMLGLYSDQNGEGDGVEAWLTVEEAERVRNLLDTAIRRHTAYREIGR